MRDDRFEKRAKSIGDYGEERRREVERMNAMGVEEFYLSEAESKIVSGHLQDSFERGMYDPVEEAFLERLVLEMLKDGNQNYGIRISIKVTDKKKNKEYNDQWQVRV